MRTYNYTYDGDTSKAMALPTVAGLLTMAVLTYLLTYLLTSLLGQVRIGVHTGRVTGGIIGKRRFQFDMWGNGVNGGHPNPNLS